MSSKYRQVKQVRALTLPSAGATAEEMSEAQAGRSEETRTNAALAFVDKFVQNRANVTGADITELRSAGFDDEDLVELVAHVALNLFTNYINVALAVPVDFPKVALLSAR